MHRSSGAVDFSRLIIQGVFSFLLVLMLGMPAFSQSTATLQGTVTDTSNAAVPNAKIVVHNAATGVERATQTDQSGAYLVPGLLPGVYTVTVSADGFQTFVIRDLKLDVATTVSENAQLKVGGVTQEVVVSGGAPLVNTSTPTVGQVINQTTVQQIPLNGRHFVDLGLLVPGTVTPPQNGFLTAPLRGQGSFAINTAGQREDTTNWMINGINLSDEVQNQITFQPSITTVSEFKIDNSTFPAEYGRNSGAIVNIATRSGTNDFHGELFEFLRNNYFDARNFFNPVRSLKGVPNPQSPFIRNDFGVDGGGPIVKNKAFFFLSYEGNRQRQAISLSSHTFSQADQAQIAATGDAAVQKVAALLPAANDVGTGNPADPTTFNGFLGGTVAPVNIDQGSGDLSFVINQNDHLHGYINIQQDRRQEPVLQGNSLPNWGDTRASRRQIMTIQEDHIFGPSMTNEARLGYNRIHITFAPNRVLNPADFSIDDGVSVPLAIPQISISNFFNIGGPSGFPQGRGDTTVGFSDTMRYLRGSHSFAFGGEVRRFYNDNFAETPGTFNFTSVANFISDNANSFSTNLGNGASKLLEPAFGLFVQDSYKLRPNLTLELGLRYDDNMTISEAENRFVTFDPVAVSLVQTDSPYNANDKNFQPRVGFAWDPWGDGKTAVRGGYAILTDQPVSGIVTGLTVNPPFGDPRTIAGSVSMTSALTSAAAAGLAPNTIFHNFHNPYVQSWSLTVQHQLGESMGLQIGYIGSKGTHLRLPRNLNQAAIGQQVEGANKLAPTRPFASLSATSPIDPGATLGNIIEVDSSGNSNYNALWVTANKRFSQGLQFSASYTFSRSFDYNSLNGNTVEDSTNPRLNYGPSDFDARHRFVINAVYDLPFKGNRLVSGWELAGISQAQSGNPLTIGYIDATPLGLSTLRPDASGPIHTEDVAFGGGQYGIQWIANPGVLSAPRVLGPATSPCNSTCFIYHFGNLGRNTVIGPTFVNTDFSIIKRTKITERVNSEFRAEFFDIFNHPNFGNPNLSFGGSAPSGAFGLISSTRFPTGDFGSSRQIQFALKLEF